MPSILDRITQFSTALSGAITVYQDGQRAGSSANAADLCAGRIAVNPFFKGALTPSKWYVIQGNKQVGIGNVCIAKGLRPTWMSETEAKELQAQPLPAPVPSTGLDFGLDLATPILGGKNLVPLLIAGAVAVTGIAVLASGGDYRRRR